MDQPPGPDPLQALQGKMVMNIEYSLLDITQVYSSARVSALEVAAKWAAEEFIPSSEEVDLAVEIGW